MSAISKICEEITIAWRIENFSFCCKKPGHPIASPEFFVESLNDAIPFLVFDPIPMGYSSSASYIHCTLDCINGKLDEKSISNEKIDIISADGEILGSKKITKKYSQRRPLADNKIMKIRDLAKKMENCKEDSLIIRYYFTIGETGETKLTRYEIKTRVGVDRCSLQCSAANFVSTNSTHKKFCFPKIQTKFNISLRVPEDVLHIDIVNIYQIRVMPGFATCTVSVLDAGGVERHSEKYTRFFDIEEDFVAWSFSSGITKTQLNSEGHAFLKNSKFTVMCELSISNGIIESEIHSKCAISSPVKVFLPTDTFSSLKEDLRSMFTSKKHSDVKLQVGVDLFPAHKSLLSARSTVFSTMFEQDMLENQTGIVDISNMDAETLNSFLLFVYTGTVDTMDYEVTLKLMLAADKYQVESLKEKCASFLTSNLSDGNACEVLTIADMVGHKLLKESAQDYIRARAGTILPSQEWSQWIVKNVRLASEIISKLSLHFGLLANEESIPPKYDTSSAPNVSPMDAFSSLKEDLQNIFISKKHSDVKLQVAGDIFPVHKSFLCARSPVFSTMFDQDMLESQSGIVDIPDMDAETLNTFLSFLYTGTVDKMDYEVTLKLLLAADKYQVESLKEKCASILMSDLCDGNACDILVIADMVEHKLLKEFVQEYIKTHAKKILPSPEWSQWIEKNVRLASEILSKLSLQLGR